jgi:large subunit ribosomal protein L10
MAISREKKKEFITDIIDKLNRSKAVVFTDYRGLDVESINEVRNKLREQGVDYKVIKNSLFRRALAETNLKINVEEFENHPVAAAFSYEDEVIPAKVIYDYSKKNENLEILSGILEGKEVDAITVKSLAKLPSREELYAKLVGSLVSPMSGLVNVLTGNMRGLVNVLNAYKEQRSQD